MNQVDFGKNKTKRSIERIIFLCLAFTFLLLVIPSVNASIDNNFAKGMNYVSWWYNQYESLDSNLSIEELQNSTNSTWISILVTQYLDSLSTTIIHPITTKTPTDKGLINAINKAHSLGLKVSLKPHIDVGYDSSTWRGYISYTNESDWKNWFSNYSQFIRHYAQIAQDNNVEMLVIGTELKGTSQRSNDWRNITNQVRNIYSGKIVYAANHDEYQNINWWDALDYIGIDSYFPLTNKYDPSVDEIKAAFEPKINNIESFASTYNKKIILTEIGFESKNGTNTRPYYAPTSTLDLGEQADSYNATLQVIDSHSNIVGTFWWNWLTWPSQGGVTNLDFTPHGKPAELVLASFYSKSQIISNIGEVTKIYLSGSNLVLVVNTISDEPYAVQRTFSLTNPNWTEIIEFNGTKNSYQTEVIVPIEGNFEFFRIAIKSFVDIFVSDKKGNPIPNANVLITSNALNNEIYAITDSNGKVNKQKLTKYINFNNNINYTNIYDITVSKKSYQTKSESVDITNDNLINFIIRHSKSHSGQK